MIDIWAAKSQSFEYLPYLNKILDRKEGDFTKCTYYFMDGTLIDIA